MKQKQKENKIYAQYLLMVDDYDYDGVGNGVGNGTFAFISI